MEIGKYSHIASSSGYIAKVDYSGKGWVSGKKNTFTAAIWKDGHGSESSPVYSADGQWSDTFSLKEGSGKKAHEIESVRLRDVKLSKLNVAPLEEQDVFESRRAWAGVAKSVQAGDLDATSHFKTTIENAQRALRKREQEEKREWHRVFFSQTDPNGQSEAVFNHLVKMVSGFGSSAWDGVQPDKTGGMWRFDDQKASQARKPFHPEGLSALGQSADGSSGPIPMQATNVPPTY